eukprot:scaffold35477_cov96-Isochrysis_galbana.AAC.1
MVFLRLSSRFLAVSYFTPMRDAFFRGRLASLSLSFDEDTSAAACAPVSRGYEKVLLANRRRSPAKMKEIDKD